MNTKQATFLLLVAVSTSLYSCSAAPSEDIRIALDELVEKQSMMWDPTATTFFQKVLDGDIAYFTDKMIYGADQPGGNKTEPTEEGGRTKRAATKNRRFLWPGGVIPYTIVPVYSQDQIDVILKAMCTWEEHTCIRFIPRTTQRDYIEFYPGPGCSSYIGRVGGDQGVSLARSCFAFHTVLHEIGHAIGFFHEQSRPDRDEHVEIVHENIAPGAARQFRKLTTADVDSLGVGYDYNSIMHYDHNLFSTSGQSTIVALDPSIPVGGGRTLSELDIEQTNRLYRCPATHPPRQTQCPERPNTPRPLPELPYPSCGGTIDISLDQYDREVVIESPNYPTYTHGTDCVWLVRIPEGFQIVIDIQPMSIERSSRCSKDYIEVYESLDTSGFHLGKHCGSYRQYRIGTITTVAYIHYHTDASNSGAGLTGFRATVSAYDIDECRWPRPYGCSHTCNNIPGSFECSCPVGYFLSSNAKDCFDTNECGLGNGGCEHKCVNRGGSYRCECNEGFQLQSDGRSCTDSNVVIDPCEEANCAHQCTALGGLARCSCRDGYQLASDRRGCNDINECSTANGGCAHTCSNTAGSFECSCRDGYRLSSNGRACEDIDECSQSNSCTQRCVNTEGSYRCGCNDGYELQSDGTTCLLLESEIVLTSETGELQTGNWPETYPTNVDKQWLIHCPRQSQRVDIDFDHFPFGLAGALPSCPKDWVKVYDGESTSSLLLGTFCHYAVPVVRSSSTNKLLVVLHAGPNHNSARKGFRATYTCVDTPTTPPPDPCDVANCAHECREIRGVAHCTCRQGFQLTSDRRGCEDVNECSVDNGRCAHICTNAVGGYECSCRGGYQLASDRRGCNDVDECSTANGGCAHTCSNTAGSYECSCRDGYQLASDRRGCNDINECSTANGGCAHTCTNTAGSFECSCRDGYRLSSNGRACEDIDECSQSNSCTQQCINTAGSYRCGCNDGFELQSDGTTCAAQTNEIVDEGPATAIPSPQPVEDNDNDDRIVLTSETGQFQTGNWPETYPRNVDKQWLIQCPSDSQQIDIDFDHSPFGLAGALPSCPKDWVKVYDGESTSSLLLGKFCHYAVPVVRRSSTNKLLVVLHAGPNHASARKGFRATYTCVDGPTTPPPQEEATTAIPPAQPIVVETTTEIDIDSIPVPECGGILTDSHGSFSSPNWPGQTYPTNVRCEWIIVLPDEDSAVEIMFDNRFGIAGNLPECEKDWVKIYDGLDHTTAPESGPYCYWTKPATFVSSGHIAKVVLYAGPAHSSSRRGFGASYRSVSRD